MNISTCKTSKDYILTSKFGYKLFLTNKINNEMKNRKNNFSNKFLLNDKKSGKTKFIFRQNRHIMSLRESKTQNENKYKTNKDFLIDKYIKTLELEKDSKYIIKSVNNSTERSTFLSNDQSMYLKKKNEEKFPLLIKDIQTSSLLYKTEKNLVLRRNTTDKQLKERNIGLNEKLGLKGVYLKTENYFPHQKKKNNDYFNFGCFGYLHFFCLAKNKHFNEKNFLLKLQPKKVWK